MKELAQPHSIIISRFHNVPPILSFKEGCLLGNYTDCSSVFSTEPKNKRACQQKSKTIELILFPGLVIDSIDLVALLRAEGKQLCENAPWYLFGLMEKVPEPKMPPELANKDIIAIEELNRSSFFKENSPQHFVCVRRANHDNFVVRTLSMVEKKDCWSDNWTFIVENLDI